MMKKVFLFIFISIFVFSSFSVVEAKEKTLDELSAEASANRKAYNAAKSEKDLTEDEKNEVTSKKIKVEEEISSIREEITKIEEEITKIQEDIKKKDKQMKEIMSFVQISNGETNYLEYIFGATDFTDFIYRVSVAEQLGDFNKKLIDEYNRDIEKLDNKKKELVTKQDELNKKSQELAELEAKLSVKIEKITEGMSTQDDEYKTTIALIKSLKALGCAGNETKSSCQARIAAAMRKKASSSSYTNTAGTPVSGSFYMPLARGYMTSDYGARSLDYHTGIDFSNGSVSNVYPVTAGRVVHITYGSTSTCGNHIVYVYHDIKGGYTTSYWHLTNARVSVGQDVYPNTVLGQTGGAGYSDGYYSGGKFIKCAYGGHVHLNLFNGLATTNSGRINPRTLINNIPREGTYFTSPR